MKCMKINEKRKKKINNNQSINKGLINNLEHLFKIKEVKCLKSEEMMKPNNFIKRHIVLIIDGNTFPDAINLIRDCPFDCHIFISKKYLGIKPLSASYHQHRSNGHQITFWCGRMINKWLNFNSRIYFLSNERRYEHLVNSIQNIGIPLHHIHELKTAIMILNKEIKRLKVNGILKENL